MDVILETAKARLSRIASRRGARFVLDLGKGADVEFATRMLVGVARTLGEKVVLFDSKSIRLSRTVDQRGSAFLLEMHESTAELVAEASRGLVTLADVLAHGRSCGVTPGRLEGPSIFAAETEAETLLEVEVARLTRRANPRCSEFLLELGPGGNFESAGTSLIVYAELLNLRAGAAAVAAPIN